MSSRKEFLIKLNEAFANCDTPFISNSVTNNFEWRIIGEKKITGRAAFEEALERMKRGGPMKISLSNMVNEKEKAVVEGMVEMKIEPGDIRQYSFCDIYIFKDADSNKIKELRTYISGMKKKK